MTRAHDSAATDNEPDAYAAWNRALSDWATAGVPLGQPVTLTVDEESLAACADGFLDAHSSTDACEAFLAAVRHRCVTRGNVDLTSLRGCDREGRPRGVAFLALLVLAAHSMISEEDDDNLIAEHNFFSRLRQRLGLDATEKGRPRGMEQGEQSEEPLWLDWNTWLESEGWVATATRSDKAPRRFIGYALSQALLLRGERLRIAGLFHDHWKAGQLSLLLDRASLAHWLGHIAAKLGRRLGRVFDGPDSARREAFAEAAFELYTQPDWQAAPAVRVQNARPQTGPVRLMAGLYRREDAFGGIEYFVYPQQPRRFRASGLAVHAHGQEWPLIPERPGWFFPVWMGGFASPGSFPVSGSSLIESLVVPAREFWIVVANREDEHASDMASWARPELAEAFLLICRERHIPFLETLRREKLIQFGDVARAEDGVPDGWIEVRRCMVQARDLGCVVTPTECQELASALAVAAHSRIDLRGGLRVPRSHIWLEGFPPEACVVSFSERAVLRIRGPLQETPKRVRHEQPVNTNRYLQLPPLPPGTYELTAQSGNGAPLGRRAMRIDTWQRLVPAQLAGDAVHQLAAGNVLGAWVMPTSGEG